MSPSWPPRTKDLDQTARSAPLRVSTKMHAGATAPEQRCCSPTLFAIIVCVTTHFLAKTLPTSTHTLSSHPRVCFVAYFYRIRVHKARAKL
jgi:hypothetical protein